MVTTTVRISTLTRDLIADLAQSAGISMNEVIAQAVEVYRRQRILSATNEAYLKLKTNSNQWNEFQKEITGWDQALLDGIEEV